MIAIHAVLFGGMAFVLENRRMGNQIDNLNDFLHAVIATAQQHGPVVFLVFAVYFGVNQIDTH